MATVNANAAAATLTSPAFLKSAVQIVVGAILAQVVTDYLPQNVYDVPVTGGDAVYPLVAGCLSIAILPGGTAVRSRSAQPPRACVSWPTRSGSSEEVQRCKFAPHGTAASASTTRSPLSNPKPSTPANHTSRPTRSRGQMATSSESSRGRRWPEFRDADGNPLDGSTRVTFQKADRQGNPIGGAIVFTEFLSRFKYTKMRTDPDFFRTTDRDLMIDEYEHVLVFVDIPENAASFDPDESRLTIGDETSDFGKPVEIVRHADLSAEESAAVKAASQNGTGTGGN